MKSGQLKYKLMLVCATIIWGLAFVVMKNMVDFMSVGWLLASRFIAAGIIMAAVFYKQVKATFNKQTIFRGFIVGIFVFCAYYFQTQGLILTTAGKNAFLTAFYIVIVPFMWWGLAKQKPTKFNIIASILAVIGGGFVSLQAGEGGLTLNFGDMLTLFSALFFTLQFIAVKFWGTNENVLALSMWQFLFAGIISFFVALVSEPFPSVDLTNQDFWIGIVYVTVFSTAVGIGFQNIGTANCDPAPAALIMSLEGVFGVIFSVLITGEVLTLQILIGFALIFTAIIVSEVIPIYTAKSKDAISR